LPGSVRVQVLDRAAAAAAHQPLLLRVGRADGSTAAASVRVSLDYAGFARAFGADWSTRLALVQLPECALTTPAVEGCRPVPLASTNNATTRTVSADVVTAGAGTLLAATTGPSGPAGDFTATQLAPSATWQAGASAGARSGAY